MSEQKKTRADVIEKIEETNALLRKLIDVLTRGQSQSRNTRTTVGGGSAPGHGGSGGSSTPISTGGGGGSAA